MNIRYITGRGGSGTGGLSAYLRTLSNDFDVLPIDPDFLVLDLEDQINSVRQFVTRDTGNVIANSYGAYLLLQALIDQPPCQSRILLLSPVLGRALDKERMLFSRPPREKTLRKAIAEGRLGAPLHLEIVTGQEDEICDAALAADFGRQLNIKVSILDGQGHMLDPSTVSQAVGEFLRG